jgi:hypothetical protein
MIPEKNMVEFDAASEDQNFWLFGDKDVRGDFCSFWNKW